MSPEKGVISSALRPEVLLRSSKWGCRSLEILFIHQWKMIRLWIKKWETCIWLPCNVNHLPYHLVSNGNYLTLYWEIFPYYRKGGKWHQSRGRCWQKQSSGSHRIIEWLHTYMLRHKVPFSSDLNIQVGFLHFFFFLSRMQVVWHSIADDRCLDTFRN